MPSIPANLGEITIRYLRPEDADTYIALEKDSEVKRFMGGATPKSDAELRTDLKRYEPSNHLLAIAGTMDQYLGRCGYLRAENENEREVYLLLGPQAQRRGLGKLVVPFLESLVISNGFVPVAYVDPSHAASIKLLQSLGWVNTGAITKKNYQKGHLIYSPPKVRI